MIMRRGRRSALACCLAVSSALSGALSACSSQTATGPSQDLYEPISASGPTTVPTPESPPPSPTRAPSPTQAPSTTQGRAASWACIADESDPRQTAARTEQFVTNIGRSGLPAPSKAALLRQVPAIDANMNVYCAAERATGVPALALAAIHYREANNDPTRSILSGESLGAVNPDSGVVEGTDRLDNAVRAARHLQNNGREIYGVPVDASMTTADLVYALAAYNRGGRYCRANDLHPMMSPYVAAGLVEQTVAMTWPDVGGDSGDGPAAWGEPASVRGRPDRRLGAVTILRGLGSEITNEGYAWDTEWVQVRCRS